MWWREQPFIWAMDEQSIRVTGVRELKSVGVNRIYFVCTDRGLEILGDGLLLHSWDRTLAEVRGKINRLQWVVPGGN